LRGAPPFHFWVTTTTVRPVRSRGRQLHERLAAGGDRAGTPASHLRLLAGIVILAAALRFATLGTRSFWIDEAVVVNLVGLGLVDMLDALLSGTEASPPLYYTLAWAWTSVLGTGEEGLRSLSAVLGTATVPVAYLAGRELLSSRAGLLAALVFALNPMLIWHGQDGRSYTLAVLLSALSFLFFLRCLRDPRGRTLALWAAFSALGLLTHYFVGFVIAVEAVLLLIALGPRRALLAALGVVATVELAALSIALEQRANVDLAWRSTDGISATEQYGSLASRLLQAPAQVLVGEQPPLQVLTAFVAAILVIPALVVLVRTAGERERQAALVAAAVGVPAVAAMVLAALAGVDYFNARNTLPILLPLVLVFACAFAAPASRAAVGALAALMALWLAIHVTTAGVPKFEREDWRGSAHALGAAEVDRAVVVTPQAGRGPLRTYLPDTSRLPRSGARVREIDLVGLPPLFREIGETPEPPRPDVLPDLPPQFRLVERREETYYTLLRFRSRVPVFVGRAPLAASGLGDGSSEVLLQRAQRRDGSPVVSQ
jgi:mannosyltransferase